MSEVNIVQKLDKSVQLILTAIIELECLLPRFERLKLKTMLDQAASEASESAECVFGLSAIAGFSIAIAVDEQKKKVASEVARGN